MSYLKLTQNLPYHKNDVSHGQQQGQQISYSTTIITKCSLCKTIAKKYISDVEIIIQMLLQYMPIFIT